jgi:hypothetical protein
MDYLTADIQKVHLFRFNMGDDLLEELQRGVEAADISNGVIVAGVGSLVSYHIHVVGEKARPVPNIFVKEKGGYDITAMQGYILDGRVHAHITVSDAEKAIGGHLEPGCEVYTFVAVTIVEVAGVDLTDMDAVRWPE